MVDSNSPESTAMPIPPPVNMSDPGRGPLIIGLMWTFSILCSLVLGLRFWIRTSVAKRLAMEDWLMLAAGILNLACVSCLTVSYHWGFGKHDKDLTFNQLVNITKWIWMAFTPGILTSILARISVATLLIRLFGSKTWLKWFLIVITILQVVSSLTLTITSWAQVSPIEGLWNPLIDARRWDPSVVALEGNVTGSLFAFGDLCYVLFPVSIVWKLNMPFHQKLGLCILLAMSLFTMGVSIAKAFTAQNGMEKVDDAQYHAALGLLWALTEQTFVIMMGCAPFLTSITKLEIPFVMSIFSSTKRLISSPDAGYKLEVLHGPAQAQSNQEPQYDELGFAGQTLSQVQAGKTSSSFDKMDVHRIDPGRIYRTDRYMVTTRREGEMLEGDSVRTVALDVTSGHPRPVLGNRLQAESVTGQAA